VSPKLSYVARSNGALPALVITTVEPSACAEKLETPLIAEANAVAISSVRVSLGQSQMLRG
jgi:hypothetical protein